MKLESHFLQIFKGLIMDLFFVLFVLLGWSAVLAFGGFIAWVCKLDD